MTTPDSGFDVNPVWAVIVAIGAVFLAWLKKADPRVIVTWAVRPAIQPIQKDIAYIKAVVDELPGAKKAKAAAKAKMESWEHD